MPRNGLGSASVTEAGAVLADETGFHELSMGVLAGRLGVRTPSLYKHVDSLADLSRRVAVLAAGELAAALQQATAGPSGQQAGSGPSTGQEALSTIARTVWTYARAHPGRWTALNSARPAGPDDPLIAERDRLLASFAAGLKGYRLRPDQSVHALRMLRSTLHGFVSLQALGGFQRPEDVQESLAWTVAFLDRGLRSLHSDPLAHAVANSNPPAGC